MENFTSVVRMDERINAQSTISLLKQIEVKHDDAKKIYIICDNARYYRSRLVKEYLLNAIIELVFLPPYSPNLNLIERYWKFFKKKVLYNKYYPTFNEFNEACTGFLERRKNTKKSSSHSSLRIFKSSVLKSENYNVMGILYSI